MFQTWIVVQDVFWGVFTFHAWHWTCHVVRVCVETRWTKPWVLTSSVVWSFFACIDSLELVFVGAYQSMISPWFQYCHPQLQVTHLKFHIKRWSFFTTKNVPPALQVFVANHTSMIDFIILEQMTAFAVIMQKHPGWVGQSYSCTLYRILPHCVCISDNSLPDFALHFPVIFVGIVFFMALFMWCSWQLVRSYDQVGLV